jgi:predicted nucleotidyltransferase
MSPKLVPVAGALSPVLELGARLGVEWPSIIAARERAAGVMARLQKDHGQQHIVVPNTTLVVFGSLARGEVTEGSDIDWTLLVDGSADPEHLEAAQRISARLREKKPAEGGPFGSLTFSHDLIHKIGGDDDSNHNTTQRLLLLLESAPIGNPGAYDRVVRNVLKRYVEEDITSPEDTAYRVPRFLQNDISRYWRTMAVDFAHKRRVRGGKGWAIRNAKLRLSRKLMYAAGLLTCFSCDTVFRTSARGQPLHDAQQVVDHLYEMVRTMPLDIIAGVVLSCFGKISVSGEKLFTAYDEFLALLHDKVKRKHLNDLLPDAADGDPEYQKVRELGTRFQDALTEIFLVKKTPVRELTIRYGVF